MIRLYRPGGCMDGWAGRRTDGWGRTDTGSVPTCGPTARIGVEVGGENRLRECPHQYGLSLETIFAADAYYSRSQKVVFGYRNTLRQESKGLFAAIVHYSRSPEGFFLPSYIISRVRKYFGAGICYARNHETIFGAVVHYFGT